MPKFVIQCSAPNKAEWVSYDEAPTLDAGTKMFQTYTSERSHLAWRLVVRTDVVLMESKR